jgi:hypothetical protein
MANKSGRQKIQVASNRQNWLVSASQQTSLAETAFSFWSFVFESAGSSLKKKKKKADSKTANLILGETKG